MRSSSTISLFSAQTEPNRQPYTFLISLLAHGAAFALLFFGIASAPKMKPRTLAERFDLRQLELHTLDTEMARDEAKAVKSLHKDAPKRPSSSSSSEQEQTPLMRQVALAMPARQTLVQPDVLKPVKLPDIPVPTVVIWNAAKTRAKVVVAPLPTPPPMAAAVMPSLQKPTVEPKLADIALPSASLPKLTQHILPSTTSPVVLQAPKPTPPAPITTAAGSAQPTAAAVMSLSDMHMANGAVTLPPVNETAAANSPGALAEGQAKTPSEAGHGNPAGKAGDKPAGKDAGSASASNAGDSKGRADNAKGANTASGQAGFGLGSQTVHITRPKEGKFGAVIVGSALQEQYPETADLSSGKMAYTVYVPVGLQKSWPLQYWLANSESAAQAGSANHIEAPYPYDIIRPNIAPGSFDADALIVHGFINQKGRFEALTVIFPPEFAQAQFVLNALALWEFRPATQNGQDVKVEVLLIIPEIPE
ncbi:MAG: hypothetical protein ABSD44_06110 [Terracidiphilus sp.]